MNLEAIARKVYGNAIADIWLEFVRKGEEAKRFYRLEGQKWSTPSAIAYKPTVLTVNLMRWFIDTRANWLFERAPDIEVPPREIDSPEAIASTDYSPSPEQLTENRKAEKIKSICQRVWDENYLQMMLINAAREQLISGAVGLLVVPSRDGISIQIIPSRQIMPKKDEMGEDYSEFHVYSLHEEGYILSKWAKFHKGVYRIDGYHDTNGHLVKEISFTYPCSTFPLIYVPFSLLPGEEFPTGIATDLIPVLDQINKTLSDSQDSLKFNLFAMTILINAPPGAEQELKVSPGEVWNIGGHNVDVRKLESRFEYAQALKDHLTHLIQLAHQIAEVPHVTPEHIRGVGFVSGVGLRTLYASLVSATQAGHRVWKAALEKLNRCILEIIERTPSLTSLYGDPEGRYDTRVICHLPLPENVAEKTALQIQRVASGLQSVRGALAELGERYPERKMGEILREKRAGIVGEKEVGLQEAAKVAEEFA